MTERNKPIKNHPFRRAVLRGLGVVLPPLLTIVVFLWAWGVIQDYALEPLEDAAEQVIVLVIKDVQETQQGGYRQVPTGSWIPAKVFREVESARGDDLLNTPTDYYERYVRIVYLSRSRVIPLFLIVFVLLLYLLGKFLAAGFGRWSWSAVEGMINRIPFISNVYSSVKQVTDFVFSDHEIEFNRVVAVEYPRRGIWSIGFVTSESMKDIRAAVNEPVVSVLMPTSPMPATGFTVTVKKSETIDLDITFDQAIQFVVSCGVVVPSQQQQVTEVAEVINQAVADRATQVAEVPVENTDAGPE